MIRSEDSILRKPSELKRFMENRGIDFNSEIITYCGSVGTLSGLGFFCFKNSWSFKCKTVSKIF